VAGKTDLSPPSQEMLADLAARLRASGKLGRSDLFIRLFDFLLEQSLAGRSPKEFEIAQEVFGKDAGFDVFQDSSVRVHIHRLRRKLDEVYAGTRGARLTIPRGEYRLAVEPPEAPEPEAEQAPPEGAGDGAGDSTAPAQPASASWLSRPRWQIGLAACAIFLLGLLAGSLAPGLQKGPATDPRAETAFWKPLAANRRITFIATGDYYIFGEAPNRVQVSRLVREFAINSREDLDEYLMMHPEDYQRYVDLDLHYLPVSAGYAMRDIVPLMSKLSPSGAPPWMVTMSRLTPEAMKGSNIVYIGFLSGLGMLRDPLFEASGFSIGSSYDELIDKASGKRYLASWSEGSEGRRPWRDLAYLASIPGPSGNRILVIAGTRDAAVVQAAEIAADKAQLDQIAAKAGDGDAFEALYEVRTLGTLNLGSKLLVARPIKSDGLWRPDARRATFPDELHSDALPPPPTSAAP